MIEIFSRYKELKFTKIVPGTKRPVGAGWQKNGYSYIEALEYYNKGNSYGLLCGYGGLIIIDADLVRSSKNNDIRFPELDNDLPTTIEKLLPETLTVQTGSGGKHYYFICDDLDKKMILESKRKGEKVHWGEVQSWGAQALGPGSMHPATGNKYKIINKKDIAKISAMDLYNALYSFLIPVQESIDSVQYEVDGGIDSINVKDIFSLSGLKNDGGQYMGPHPVHGSTGGSNFWLDPTKNVWHCFRCNSGGGPASAIAVKEGIISCSEATRGRLTGDKFKEVIAVARERYNLTERKKEHKTQKFEDIKKEEEQKLNLWTFKDFENYEVDNNFLIEKILYPKSVNMLYSPPGEFKSIMAVYMAMAIAQGKEWCGYGSQQNAVLYCDKENNDKIIRERLMAMYKGLEYKDKEMPLYFLRREGDLIINKRANHKFIDKLLSTVKDNEIKVVFFDTMHRFGDYDENSSDDINLLYTQVFQPLIEKHGCSIVFLHHTTKDGNFRGSGDFLGMVDTAYKFERSKKNNRKSNKVKIINEKNRSGEIEEMAAHLDFIMKEEDELELLNAITITSATPDKIEDKGTKFKEASSIIAKHLAIGEMKMKRDFKEILENEDVECSDRTLINVLNWFVDKGIFIKDKMHRYKLSVNVEDERI